MPVELKIQVKIQTPWFSEIVTGSLLCQMSGEAEEMKSEQ